MTSVKNKKIKMTIIPNGPYVEKIEAKNKLKKIINVIAVAA